MTSIRTSTYPCAKTRQIEGSVCWNESGAAARAAITALFLLALSVSVVQGMPAEPMHFERIGLEDGLSQNTVLDVIQDSEGFIWIATEDGLNRYDGSSFIHFRSLRESAEDGLASSYIKALSEGPDGNVWIATDGGGVSRWDRRRNRFSLFRHDPADAGTLSTDFIQTIHVSPDGVAWVGTRDSGLDRIDPLSGKVRHYRHSAADEASLSSDAVLAIEVDRTGQLWIGTENGLNRFDPATDGFQRYLEDPADLNSLPGQQVRSIAEDRSGALWVGTLDGGLGRLDRNSGTVERFQHDPENPNSLSHNAVRSILEDAAGRIWVGTVRGLNLFDRDHGSFSRYVSDPSNPHSLSNHEIMALYQDRGGLLWVATKSGGLNTWNPRTWSFGHHTADPKREDALSHPVVSSFSRDSLGRLWVGTVGGGLNRFNAAEDRWDHFAADPADPRSLNSDYVMAILHDHQGTLWVGTMNAGVARYDAKTKTFRTFRHDPQDPTSLSSDAVMSLFEDREGNLWIGTFGGGISRFDRNTGGFTRFAANPDDPRALAGSRVTAFAQDLSGTLWVGTDGGGLHIFDSVANAFHRFQHDADDASTVSSNTVYALHLDAGGTVWVGTRGGGLVRVEGSSLAPNTIRFHSYSTSHGFSNQDIYGIQSDLQGNLWVSTNAGLSRFNPVTLEVQNFFRSNGLQESEFNFGAHYRSSTGELFFGGINGFNAFYPTSLETNSTPPPLALTSIRVNHQELDAEATTTGRLDLGYRDRILLFEFAALDFADPGANRYAYKLEGFDPEWVELGAQRRVTYTNLKAGEYLLRVKASNSDGVWTEKPLSLTVSVEAAPWFTWWAYLLYCLTIVAAIYAFVRHQQAKVVREEQYSQQLETEVRNRTSELNDRNAELKSVNGQLLEASLTDSLTGLRNRRFFFEQVAKDIAMVRRRHYEVVAGHKRPEVFDMAFLMIDLDHFKSINDSCGHAAGDHVLLEIRSILLECSRDSDIVIRWGGDEFLVIARDTDGDQATAVAERIRQTVAARVFRLGNGQIVRTTCSIGLSRFPFIRSHPDAVTWEQVVQFADSAMYEAKQTRDTWVEFAGTETTLACDGVLGLIREMPERLAEDGRIRITRSADPHPAFAPSESSASATFTS